jgi:succinyl-diaminopimelate desuccinylase
VRARWKPRAPAATAARHRSLTGRSGGPPDARDHPTLRLLEALIARRSVTPDDAGCQALLAERLARWASTARPCPSAPTTRVSNLWAVRRGASPEGPTVVLAGHTDVVPTGPLEQWTSDPFVPTHRDGQLYGRGAADMKTSVAAMVVAAEEFVAAHPRARRAHRLAAHQRRRRSPVDGTVQGLRGPAEARGQRLDACIVGEPTSVERLGDMVKNGRRGTLSGRLVVKGIQGHMAYPQLARNPIHLPRRRWPNWPPPRWDEGNDHFPPTTWQVSNIHAGTGARNVIPGSWRWTSTSASAPRAPRRACRPACEEVLRRHGLEYMTRLDAGWRALPHPTRHAEPGAGTGAIEAECGVRPLLSTTGGTSDGRFIARICPQVVEFGPINASIHKIDEWVAVADVDSR